MLQSIPDMAADQERLNPIQGNVPSVRSMPAGCRFAPRCSKAMDICKQEPPMVASGSHECKCWLYADKGERQ
ncbi:oligopeptide/dipeptide ABC transporter ATP-binding protein [Gordoniibacillus kamchatkensis]|uniref:oligopeptide/dipeptide ABC transporter ATP-binding protein n=1 Tax=Gordoniibacillus kamchatkensis TaxID=1590651 RepID=UPI002F407272